MRNRIIIGVIISVLLVSFCLYFVFKKEDNMPKEKQLTRQPAVAGQFYPADKEELSEMIEEYLNQAEVKDYPGTPQVLIIPHAGYIYSGRVAAYAFKSIKDKDFKRAVIIGRSHNHWFDGVAADGSDVWETPLGKIAVDKEFINLLKDSSPVVTINSLPHQPEHSLEVMVPFLIKILGEKIKIVPLLFGNEKEEDVLALAKALEKTIDSETVVIISSDLSHYPSYNEAQNFDKKTMEAILTADLKEFEKRISSLENLAAAKQIATLACAQSAISTALILAEKLNLQSHLLKYANSGDYFPETKSRVVGYTAISFNNLNIINRELNKEEQKLALEITRQTLKAAFSGQDYQPSVAQYPVFQEKRGAFVTLRKHGQLRGCIGSLEPSQPLWEVIKSMALAAAFNDVRFFPLREEELDEVEIEISVLSPREKISDPKVIEIGKHGVYLQQGSRGGVYLPQVALEQGWDKETFLNSLCEQKAGLEKDCWKNGTIDLYVFTAQVFEEK